MRTLKRNTQKMYYSTLTGIGEPTYKLDDLGNKIISYMDPDTGEVEYEVEEEGKEEYTEPLQFYGNIAMSGNGMADGTEFGLDFSDYNAVLILSRNSLPLSETSLIWYESEPKYDSSGNVLPESADYNIVKVADTINVTKYVLKKRVK